jgi:hypothetical protein
MDRDVLAAGLAPKKTYQTRQGQGVWVPNTGGVELNPVAIPSIVNPDADNDPAKVINRRRKDYNALSDFRAGMGVQGGVGWNYPTPDRSEEPVPDAATIYYPGTIMPQQMKALAEKYPGVVLADTGNSLNVYPYYKGAGGLEVVQQVLQDEKALEEMLGVGTRVRPTTMWEGAEGSPVKGGYSDFEEAWKTPGQGNVTRRIIKAVKGASKDYRNYLDSAPVRQTVQDLYDLDEEMGTKGYKLRPDVQLMRKRFAEGGIQGLQEALDRGEELASNSLLDRFRSTMFG